MVHHYYLVLKTFTTTLPLFMIIIQLEPASVQSP
jgi:hypothetical protein